MQKNYSLQMQINCQVEIQMTSLPHCRRSLFCVHFQIYYSSTDLEMSFYKLSFDLVVTPDWFSHRQWC